MDHCFGTAELGDTLVHDLATVLDKNFGYKGSFAYSENRPDAPNPFLTITDIGPISLPISEVDAKRIITCATPAPFGLGTSTVIDKEVRDTWQIDPSLVSFQNPAWESFLRCSISQICSGLGMSVAAGYGARYKLHKLLLYETGSHFRPHQDTQKEDGMFATMVIVLPSQYTGGEIIVSHGSISKIIDVSASCMTSLSMLSWYTDVMHEVKPITSGYRLVLSYNLMRRSLAGPEPVPTADNTSELTRLREILERWRTGGYTQLPKQHMVALILEHQYSESDMDMGQAALKGQDAHKVNQISSVAQMLGFELWLAKYERYTLEALDVEDDESDGEVIQLGPSGDIIEDLCTLEYFTDLKGSRVHGKIEDFDVRGLMGNPDSMDPDDEKKNAGYKGNEPASIEYWYHRTAFVIFHKEDMDRVMINACGATYGLDKLQPSLNQDNPTPENKKIADLLLEHNTMTTSIWKSIAEFPLRWHDLDLWDRTIKRCPQPLSRLRQEIFLAWDIFGFHQVQSSYETIVSEIRYNHYKIEFIHEIKARADSLDEREIIETWYSEQIVSFMKKFKGGFFGVDSLISIAKEDGIKFLKDFEGQHCNNYLLEKIINVFMSEKKNIYASPPNQPGSNNGEDLDQIFNDFLDKCIRGVTQYMDNDDYLLFTNSTYGTSRQNEITRILRMIELCITTKRVDECANIFRFIWNARGDALKKLMRYYIPLTVRLRTRLQELGTSLLSPPFATFARNVIGYYLSHMLGSKTHNPRSSPPTLPCNQGCKTCASLREFFKQLYIPQQDFCVSRKTRKHFVVILHRLGNFVSFTEVTSSRYRVAKHRDFLISHRWEHRLKQARDVLTSIGADDFIEQLMGDQFEDLKIALDGKSCYNYAGPLPRHEPQEGELSPDHLTYSMTDMEEGDIEDDMEDDMEDGMEEDDMEDGMEEDDIEDDMEEEEMEDEMEDDGDV